MTADVRAALAPFCEGKTGEMLVFEHDAKPGEPICGTGLYRGSSASRNGPVCPGCVCTICGTRSRRRRSEASRSTRFSG
jgi:hypothetical protein